jgi:hypothetical protein
MVTRRQALGALERAAPISFLRLVPRTLGG